MVMNSIPSLVQPMPMLAITVGWFDLLFVVVLALGFWVGRKRGASNEHFPLLKWIAMCVAGAFLSGPLGGLMHKWLGLSQYSSQIFGYAIGFGMIFIAFTVLGALNVNQILDGDFFGKGEPHVGGLMGSLKLVAILMVPLAMIHGRLMTENQMNNTLHGKLYAGVFQQSLSGTAIGKVGGFMLIKPAEHTAATRDRSVGAQKDREMEAASAAP